MTESDPFVVASEIFEKVSDLTAEERQAFFEANKLAPCVVLEVESLLKYDKQDDVFGDSRQGEIGVRILDHSDSQARGLPTRIGDYRIIRLLGEGGTGVVYAAQREGSDEVAAIKILRPGLESDALVKRFKHEAAVLKRLRHRGIAAFSDSGRARLESADGVETTLNFLAMEFVDGLPITRFASRAALGDDECLELMARVCDAMQHAHEAGMVHRDLKPGNILVVEDQDRIGQPKVLDFGIARAADDGRGDLNTMTQTMTGMLLGTIPYMSPEQLSGVSSSNIDARSDVYALGVLTFELLSGRLPHNVRGLALPIATRVITEEEPTRLGSVHARLRGEVEVLVGKALEKEPERRYASAADFAIDLRACVAGEPISARPPTWSHGLAKFARRHRGLAVGLSIAFVALIAGLVISISFSLQEGRARRQADRDAYRARMSATEAALERSDVASAERNLMEAPEPLRGWEWHHLQSRIDDSLMLIQSSSIVRQLEFSKDGERLFGIEQAHRKEPGEFVEWDLKTGKVLTRRNLQHRLSLLWGRGQIYSCTTNRFLIEDARSGTVLRDLPVPSSPDDKPWRLNLSADPELIAIDSFDGSVLVGRPGSVQSFTNYECDRGSASRVLLAPHGNWLSIIAWQQVNVLSTADPDQNAEIHVGSSVNGAAVNADGSLLALNYSGQPAEIWRVDSTGKPELGSRIHGTEGEQVIMAFPPSSEILLTGGDEQRLRVWAVDDGKLLHTLKGHRGRITAIAISPDGSRIASACDEGTVRTWALDRADPRVFDNGGADYSYCGEFDDTGQLIVTGSSEGELRILDAWSTEEILKIDVPDGGNLLATTTGNGGRWLGYTTRRSARVLDLVNGKLLFELDEQFSNGIWRDLVFSPDTNRVIFQHSSGIIEEVDTKTWQVSRTIDSLYSEEARRDARPMFRFGSSGKQAVCVTEDGVALLDGETLEVLARREFAHRPFSVALSPDGGQLAVGLESGRIALLATNDLQAEIRYLEGHADKVYALAYAPDGLRLASGARDRTIRLWAPDAEDELAVLRGHEDYVYFLDFSPDGQRLISSSGDGDLRVWDFRPLAQHVLSRERFLAAEKLLDHRVRNLVKEFGMQAARERLAEDATLSAFELEVGRKLMYRHGLPY